MLKRLLKSGLLITALNGMALADSATENVAKQANAQAYSESIDQYLRQTHNGLWARAATDPYYYNQDKSRIDALFGKWQVTIQAPQPFSASIEVDATFLDTNFGTYGWDSTHKSSCFYDPSDKLKSGYSYQCIHEVDANAKTYERYLFDIKGNIISGKYYKGTSGDFINKLNSNQLYNFSGSNSKCIEPCYNDSTGELLIPKVSASGKNYSVIMKRESNGLFSLTSAKPL
ncbi:MAG: hypothetical protein NTV00_15110 [Methylococcales bacterium]|nr:hypothetical protein [Methylococcales bacterium]